MKSDCQARSKVESRDFNTLGNEKAKALVDKLADMLAKEKAKTLGKQTGRCKSGGTGPGTVLQPGRDHNKSY